MSLVDKEANRCTLVALGRSQVEDFSLFSSPPFRV